LDLVIYRESWQKAEEPRPGLSRIINKILDKTTRFDELPDLGFQSIYDKQAMGDNSVKNYPLFPEKFDGSTLRIAIVHARWNKSVIDALIRGAVDKMTESGVQEHNIVVQSVPGSFELPLACKRCASGPINYHRYSLLSVSVFPVG